MKLRKQEKVKSNQLASERLSSVLFPKKLANFKKNTLEESTSRAYPKTTFSHNNGFRRNVQRFVSFPEKQSSSEIKDDSWNYENVAKRRFTTGILRREEIFGKWNSGTLWWTNSRRRSQWNLQRIRTRDTLPSGETISALRLPSPFSSSPCPFTAITLRYHYRAHCYRSVHTVQNLRNCLRRTGGYEFRQRFESSVRSNDNEDRGTSSFSMHLGTATFIRMLNITRKLAKSYLTSSK